MQPMHGGWCFIGRTALLQSAQLYILSMSICILDDINVCIHHILGNNYHILGNCIHHILG